MASKNPCRRPSRQDWGRMTNWQPFLGFQTKIQIHWNGKDKRRRSGGVHTMRAGAVCREELLHAVAQDFSDQVTRSRQKPGSWEYITEVEGQIDVDAPVLKQPGTTFLWIANDDDPYVDPTYTPCTRPCCAGSLIETVDAIVGNACVVLNNDYYQGDWWQTSLEESQSDRQSSFAWFGTDNFFLHHPALLAVVTGLFRQAVLLHSFGLEEGLLQAVPREDTVRALSEADEKLALRNLDKMRPWIQAQSAGRFFPFGGSNWGRLRTLHRAIYKHGYDQLFAGDFNHRWGLGERATGLVNGAFSYWGAHTKPTKAGKLLNKLGK